MKIDEIFIIIVVVSIFIIIVTVSTKVIIGFISRSIKIGQLLSIVLFLFILNLAQIASVIYFINPNSINFLTK